jgi:hypothetical protein
MKSRLVGQRTEWIENIQVVEPVTAAHARGCIERKTAGENTQSREEQLFLLGQQIVAPVEECV